jgi:mannose-6-phosphate isomerase-like protein (cupin superfamily)
MRKKMMIALTCVSLVSVSIWAQQQPAAAPLQGGQVTAAEFAAIVAKQPKDRNGNQTFLQLAPYNVSMEHRVNVAQNASVHDKEAELFYVVDGTATLVTGGRLVNPTRNGDNQTAATVEGGTTKRIGKGDFILVPEGVPHWFSKVDTELTLMSLHLPRTPAK